MIAITFMSCMCIVFLFPTTPYTSAADMNYTVAVLGGVLCLSLMWYYFPKWGGIHWFKGPVPNLNLIAHESPEIEIVEKDEAGSEVGSLVDKKEKEKSCGLSVIIEEA